MTDRKSVEGSKERAIDRGQMGLVVPDGELLTSPSVAEALIRQYLGAIIALRADYNADKIAGEVALEKIKEQARAHASIFMGGSSDYAKSAWNTPDRLGAHLAAAIDDGESNETAANAYFLYLAKSLTEGTIIPHEAGEIEDSDAIFRMDALVEDALILLLGMPAPREEDEVE
jgi:hypothetical protein